MPSKSKKGSKFERETCKELSLWFSRGQRDDIFWRTAGSGARATTRAKQNLMTADSAGDVCAIHPSGKAFTKLCVLELKKGYTGKSPSKRASLMAFIDNLPNEKEPLIQRWANKVQEECVIHGRKFWFIIFQRDRKRSVICMETSTFAYINQRNTVKYIWPPFGVVGDLYLKKTCLRFMLLSDFLQWCDPESITRKFPRKGRDLGHGEEWLNIMFDNSNSPGEEYRPNSNPPTNKRKIKRRSRDKPVRKIRRRR